MDDDRTAALAEIIESLAPIPRLPTSDGEREAAELIRNRFEAAGCASRIEEVPAYPSYARPIGDSECSIRAIHVRPTERPSQHQQQCAKYPWPAPFWQWDSVRHLYDLGNDRPECRRQRGGCHADRNVQCDRDGGWFW